MSDAERIVTGTWAALAFGSLLLAGRGQQRRGGASWRRLVGVTLALTALSLAPFLAGLARFLVTMIPLRQWDLTSLIPEQPRVESVLNGILLLALSLTAHLRLMLLVSYSRQLESITLEPQPEVLTRVDELALALGVRPPRVRVQRSTGGELKAQAYAFGLVSPCLLVLDGILERLEPEERDAVLAHEVAHHSTGSLWVSTLLLSVVVTLAVVAATGAPGFLAGFAALPCYVLLMAAVWRHAEIACDLAAARVVGFGTMARSLDKIHAGHWAPNRGWRSLALYALGSHPDLVTRRAALAQAAPPDERAAIKVDRRELNQRRLAHWTALALGCLWIGLALGAPALGVDRFLSLPALLALFPLLKLIFSPAPRGAQKTAQRRLGPPSRRVAAQGVGSVLVGLFLIAPGAYLLLSRDPSGVNSILRWDPLALALLLLGGGLVAAGLVFARRLNALRGEIGAAFAVGNYARAVELGRANPRALARDPLTRHNVALASALCDDLETARAELEALADLMPWARLTLGMALLATAPETSLAQGQALAQAVPQDVSGWTVQARALERLGRLDEARVAVERALEIEPESGALHAIRALIDVGQGALTDAGRELEQAAALAPGGALTLYAAARLACAKRDTPAEGATPPPGPSRQEALAAALRAARANPFMFLEPAVLELSDQVQSQAERQIELPGQEPNPALNPGAVSEAGQAKGSEASAPRTGEPTGRH